MGTPITQMKRIGAENFEPVDSLSVPADIWYPQALIYKKEFSIAMLRVPQHDSSARLPTGRLSMTRTACHPEALEG
jgi:hypothetical protein